MTEKMQIYKCEVCGNIIEVIDAGKGQLVCCGQPMKLLVAQTADWKTEKHVPVIKATPTSITVIVGSTPHPMIETHWIEWIELTADGKTYRQYLKPGDKPEATFTVKGKKLSAREYCNIHGLWKTKE